MRILKTLLPWIITLIMVALLCTSLIQRDHALRRLGKAEAVINQQDLVIDCLEVFNQAQIEVVDSLYKILDEKDAELIALAESHDSRYDDLAKVYERRIGRMKSAFHARELELLANEQELLAEIERLEERLQQCDPIVGIEPVEPIEPAPPIPGCK